MHRQENDELTWIVMASSMKMAYPLNDVLPNVEHTRDRLLAKVFEFRRTELARVIATDEDYELLYAYGESSISLCLY
jgi:hypothetical protein